MNFKMELLIYCALIYVCGIALGVKAAFRGAEGEWLRALPFGGSRFSFWLPHLLLPVASGKKDNDDDTRPDR